MTKYRLKGFLKNRPEITKTTTVIEYDIIMEISDEEIKQMNNWSRGKEDYCLKWLFPFELYAYSLDAVYSV